MIYTVTMNPSIDYILKCSSFELGKINRSTEEQMYPGGKGINVSRVLNNLNIKNTALGFIGGFSGEFIQEFLNREGIYTDFIKIKSESRINIKLKTLEETEINGLGPTIEKRDMDKLLNKMNALSKGDYVVLSGNIQSSIPVDIYSRIQKIIADKAVKVVIDASGEALRTALADKPFLIKPNFQEFKEIFDAEINSKEDIIHYGRKLRDTGIENIIVSMAEEGAILFCSQGIFEGKPPKGEVKNSTGAGDSLLAGFLSKYNGPSDMLQAFKYSIAAGSATAFSMDLCLKDDVETLINKVKIEKLA